MLSMLGSLEVRASVLEEDAKDQTSKQVSAMEEHEQKMMNDPQYREAYNVSMLGMSIDDYKKYKQSEKDLVAFEIEEEQKMNDPWAY